MYKPEMFMNISDEPMKLLAAEYKHACEKHPKFPENTADAISVFLEELGEVAKSYNDSDATPLLLQEVAQTAVTCLRFLEVHKDEIKIVKHSGSSFIDDEDKIRDMIVLSKDEFLEVYSYISEDDYEITLKDLYANLGIQPEEDHEF